MEIVADIADIELVKLGKRMQMQIRQQAIATAQVYIRRFYLKVAIRHTNPYIIMATALYLACKTEECPLHIRTVVQEARSVWQGSESCPNNLAFADFSKISCQQTYRNSENLSST